MSCVYALSVLLKPVLGFGDFDISLEELFLFLVYSLSLFSNSSGS